MGSGMILVSSPSGHSIKHWNQNSVEQWLMSIELNIEYQENLIRLAHDTWENYRLIMFEISDGIWFVYFGNPQEAWFLERGTTV